MTKNTRSVSSVCVELCKGICCDPWWGIVFYTLTKHNGLDNLKKELSDSAIKRVTRIKENYVTKENPPRKLFKDPERYVLAVENIKARGSTLVISLRAMFAFRCVFLSPSGSCSIHPSILGFDIRPLHCNRLGTPHIKKGEEGYCRIIERVSEIDNDSVLNSTIDAERGITKTHYDKGSSHLTEAVDIAVDKIKKYCFKNAVSFNQGVKAKKTPGRNEPCLCGSGKKYKRCHGV